jgi:hypothetical protein
VVELVVADEVSEAGSGDRVSKEGRVNKILKPGRTSTVEVSVRPQSQQTVNRVWLGRISLDTGMPIAGSTTQKRCIVDEHATIKLAASEDEQSRLRSPFCCVVMRVMPSHFEVFWNATLVVIPSLLVISPASCDCLLVVDYRR